MPPGLASGRNFEPLRRKPLWLPPPSMPHVPAFGASGSGHLGTDANASGLAPFRDRDGSDDDIDPPTPRDAIWYTIGDEPGARRGR